MKRYLFLFALLLIAQAAWSAEPCLTHKFVSKQAEGADASQIRVSDWNACHSEPPKQLMWGIGCTKTACAVLEDADDFPQFWYNDTERTMTITSVLCRSNAGNPTIQLQRDDGSATNMFTTALTCDPTPTGTDGTDGILTSFVSGENVLSPGHWLTFLVVTAGGTAKAVDLSIKMTVPAP